MSDTHFPRDEVYLDKVRELISADLGGKSSEPAHILPHVYLGGQRNAESLRLLRKLGVTHVLNCAGFKGPREHPEQSPYEGLGIDYHEFKAEDTDCYDIVQHFREAFNYLDKVQRKGGVCLVHCALGINRSSATVVGYLMVNRKMTLLRAIKLVKSRRRVVLSNAGFRRQLVRFARSKNLLDPIPVSETLRSGRSDQAVEVAHDDIYNYWSRGLERTKNLLDDDRKSTKSARSWREDDGLAKRPPSWRGDNDVVQSRKSPSWRGDDDARSSRSSESFDSRRYRSASASRSSVSGDKPRLPGDTALDYMYTRFLNRDKI